jgi:hypothetical protein
MSEPVEVLLLATLTTVKDPYRSSGMSDQLRTLGTTEVDPSSGNNPKQVRKITYLDGLFYIESIYGSCKGQIVVTPASNVQWARFRAPDSQQPKAAAPKLGRPPKGEEGV